MSSDLMRNSQLLSMVYKPFTNRFLSEERSHFLPQTL